MSLDKDPPDAALEGSESPKEGIRAAAVQYEGERFTAKSHPLAWAKYKEAHPGVVIDEGRKHLCEGFVTFTDDFLSRDEALTIARKNNQLHSDADWATKLILMSGDLDLQDE